MMYLPHFDVFCDLLLNRCTATWNLFFKFIYQQYLTILTLLSNINITYNNNIQQYNEQVTVHNIKLYYITFPKKLQSRKHVHGFANKMLIRCWFLVHPSVRGTEGNFLFSGKYCVFCIPIEKVWRSESRSLVSCSYLDSISVLDMLLS